MLTFSRKLANQIRSIHQRTLGHPLRRISDLDFTMSAGLRYGDQAMNNRAIAEHLLFALQYAVHAAVEGDIAEFGCMTGRTAQVLSAGMKMVGTDKHLHLFDSFEGLPTSTNRIDLENVHVQSGVWGRGTCRGISPEELRTRCHRFLRNDAIHIHQGWFSDTLPRLRSDTRFALLHVDSDLYQSAIDVLDFVFAKGWVAPGAVILFDDWNCNRASNEHGERRAWREVVERYEIDSSDFGSYGWAGHRRIVHGYTIPEPAEAAESRS